MYSKTLTVLILFLFCVNSMIFAQGSETLTVCEVLSNLQRYDGKIVVIRGELVATAGEMDFDKLVPAQGDSCPAGLRNRMIRLSGAEPSNPPPGWSVEEDSLDRAAEKFKALLRDDPKLRRLLVTIKGVIVNAGPRPRTNVTRDPWYPAELLISSFIDIQKR